MRAAISHKSVVGQKNPYFAYKSDFIEGFKKHKTHIAIVKDKQKNTIGMVTMEDLLEELVGDMAEFNEQVKKGGKK